MKTSKHLLRDGAVALFLGFASASAHAATVTWNVNDFAQVGPGMGNSYTDTNGSYVATVSAFALIGGDGSAASTTTFSAANVAKFSGGFGVRSPSPLEGVNVNEPNHAMDNVGATELLLFKFTNTSNVPLSTLLTQVSIGWLQGDADLSVLRWGRGTTAPTIAGQTMKRLLDGGWQLVNHYATSPTTRRAIPRRRPARPPAGGSCPPTTATGAPARTPATLAMATTT